MLDLRRQPVNSETVVRREQPPRGLLDPVAQRLRLPFGVPEFLDRIVSGTTNEVDRRTLMALITTWDMAGGRPFAASSIATVGLSKTVDTVQKLFLGPVFDPFLKRLAPTTSSSGRPCVRHSSSGWASCATPFVRSRSLR